MSVTGTAVEAVAVLTGWGEGIEALPSDAARAAAGRAIVPLGRPALEGERFRRATRECLLGVAAVDALLRENRVSRDVVKGSSTALIYVTGAAYGASNHAWVTTTPLAWPSPTTVRATSGAGPWPERCHFPYTAPSVMSGEVAIEFGLTGPYGILIGGAAATIDALWQATLLLEAGRCERALVLAVETFEDCAELYARARWLVGRPLVEAAACACWCRAPAHAIRRAAGGLAARDARARPRRRDARLRAAHRAGARARGRGERIDRRHGRMARPPRRTLLALGGLWNPKKCSTSSRRSS